MKVFQLLNDYYCNVAGDLFSTNSKVKTDKEMKQFIKEGYEKDYERLSPPEKAKIIWAYVLKQREFIF